MVHFYQLLYVFSSSPLINDLCAFEDEKVVFEKIVADADSEINFRSATPADFKSLLELALESGVHSRFNKDPAFKQSEFRRLYTEWLQASLNRSIAAEVFVTMNMNEATGFITLGKQYGFVEIGLLATNPRFRGQGVGKHLLQLASVFATQNGFHKIHVATQRVNSKALTFYKKNGFYEIGNKFIYHLWK